MTWPKTMLIFVIKYQQNTMLRIWKSSQKKEISFFPNIFQITPAKWKYTKFWIWLGKLNNLSTNEISIALSIRNCMLKMMLISTCANLDLCLCMLNRLWMVCTHFHLIRRILRNYRATGDVRIYENTLIIQKYFRTLWKRGK